MNFGFTEEQQMLRDQVRRFMQEELPLTKVRMVAKKGEVDRDLWKKNSRSWLARTDHTGEVWRARTILGRSHGPA